jgi:hypothetical protein
VRIHEYTINLANKNEFAIKEKTINLFDSGKDDVISKLQKDLKIQKKIFSSAA